MKPEEKEIAIQWLEDTFQRLSSENGFTVSRLVEITIPHNEEAEVAAIKRLTGTSDAKELDIVRKAPARTIYCRPCLQFSQAIIIKHCVLMQLFSESGAKDEDIERILCHELAHVHDRYMKNCVLGLKRIKSGDNKESYLTWFADSLWEEYYAYRREYKTFESYVRAKAPGFGDYKTGFNNIEQNFQKLKSGFQSSLDKDGFADGVSNGLFEPLYSAVRLMSYDHHFEIVPGRCRPVMEATSLKGTFDPFEEGLKNLWPLNAERLIWQSEKPFEELFNVIEAAFAKLGIRISDGPDGVEISII
jgi:hypothetical protein